MNATDARAAIASLDAAGADVAEMIEQGEMLA